MRLLGLPFLVLAFLAVSCGSPRPAYTDRAQDLPPEAVSPRLQELTALMGGKSFAQITALVQTWKRWLADNGPDTGSAVPLAEGSQFTFVYYDATDKLDQVFLDASFCPGQPLSLLRWEKTRLFYRNFLILKPSLLKYRFLSSAAATEEDVLADPLHADVTSGSPVWSWLPDEAAPRVQAIDSSLEPNLAGQDLRILLPPNYDLDVSRTWQLMVVVGLDGTEWDKVLQTTFVNGNVNPLLVVALVPRPGFPFSGPSLVTHWTGDVLPWLTAHYRLAGGAANTFLMGWGDGARAVQEAAQHTELFAKVWSSPANSTSAAWDETISQILTSSFAKVAP